MWWKNKGLEWEDYDEITDIIWKRELQARNPKFI